MGFALRVEFPENWLLLKFLFSLVLQYYIHTSSYPLLTPVRNPQIKYFFQISLPIHIPGDDQTGVEFAERETLLKDLFCCFSKELHT